MPSGSKQPAAATESILTTVLTLEGHTESIPSISYFPDGKHIASGSYDKTARRWDLHAGKEIEEARDVWEQEVDAVAVSRDGRWIITAGGDSNDCGELKAREVGTGIIRTFQGHSDRINCIDISADSTLLASGAEDRTTRVWSLDTGKLLAGPFRTADKVGAIRFSLDSKKLAVKSCAAKCLEVWDVEAQKLDIRLGKYDRRRPPISDAPVFWTMKDKSIVAAFSFTDDTAKTIYEFDASTLQTTGASFEGHTDTISGLALSFDCVLLTSASASGDQTIKLWAFESRQLLASVCVQRLRYLVLSPDSCQLAYTTHDDTKIHICDTPPDILASARPAQLATINAPRNLRLADLLNSDAITGPAAARRNPMILHLTVPLPRSFPTIGSQPLHLPHPRELLPYSFHTSAVLPLRNDERSDPPEAMLQDLTKCITKDEAYPVARGGFADIWKCTYHMNERPIKVAVKALHVYPADQTSAAKEKKIKRELRTRASLKHANILPVFGYTSGFGPFIAIVSPLAENGNLTAYLEREGVTVTPVRRLQMLRDIIAGLHYLHANSVVHGDFNGPNVLIRGDGTACIAGFGLSLIYSEGINTSQVSWTSTLQGNMRWMAPELLVLEQDDGSQVRPSKQSDIYSFGGITLQVLTNKIPFHYLPNDAAIVLCIVRSEKPSRSRYPVLPEKYWQFIEQCWATDPRDRPSTERIDEMIRDELHSLSRAPHNPRLPGLLNSHTETVLPVRNDEPGDPLEVMLRDLTRYITKDEEYPVAGGGFGEIWKCTYKKDKTPIKVAVKSLKVYAADQLGAGKKKKIERIHRELTICANLNHTNILPVFGYTSGFGPFMAMVSPWAENGDLTAYLKREGETLTVVRRFQILSDIIAGLQYLHANHVIHGDFNGPNVLIHGDGTACIADFGLSLMYSEVITASKASWTSAPIQGNLPWMAPELLQERKDGSQVRPSQQSDIYSFGGIMLQVLTNKIPYYYLTHKPTIILCIANSEKPDRTRYPVLLDRYWKIIERCWSTVSQDRPLTEEVEEEIRNELDSLSKSP